MFKYHSDIGHCFSYVCSSKILDWNTAKDKMWNGIGWYEFIGPTTSTTEISLLGVTIVAKNYYCNSIDIAGSTIAILLLLWTTIAIVL